MKPCYELPVILKAKVKYNKLFSTQLINSMNEGDNYVRMLEKALLVQMDRAEDLEILLKRAIAHRLEPLEGWQPSDG